MEKESATIVIRFEENVDAQTKRMCIEAASGRISDSASLERQNVPVIVDADLADDVLDVFNRMDCVRIAEREIVYDLE